MPTELKNFRENRKRNIQKGIWISEEELDIIQKRMQVTGISSFTEYVIQMATKGFILMNDFDNLIELSKEVNRIGQNINQIAKKANTDNMVEVENIKQVLQQLNKIENMIANAFDTEKEKKYEHDNR